MRDPAPWQKKYSRMLLLACLFGLISQYLFIGKAAGISVVLFVFGFYAIFFYAVSGRLGGFETWKGQANFGWLLLLPIGMLTMTYFLFANELFRVLNVFALCLMVAVQTMWVTRNHVHNWKGVRFFRHILSQSVAQPFKNLPVPFSMIRCLMPNSANEIADSAWSRLRKVSLGLLLAVPFLLVVGTLLASADRIFQSWLAEVPGWFQGVSFGEAVLRTGAAIMISLYTFCYLWGLLFPKAATATAKTLDSIDEKRIETERKKISLDPIIAGTLLVSVNLVYILFAVIQFSYLFSAANGSLPEGIAYAEYARRGFAELVFVALLNLGLLLIGLYLIRCTGKMSEWIRKLLLSILVGCTVVMLVSAYSRLYLYEDAYGFTLMRLLVHGFMLFLGVLLVIAFIRIWHEHFSLSKAYIISSIAAYVLINYANLDYRIASTNIERFERSGIIDMNYLGRLSADAAPALLKLHQEHPELLSVKPVLDEMRKQSQIDDNWPSWNLSKMRIR
jgi:hypothetical protein